jgi:hypothetical protein
MRLCSLALIVVFGMGAAGCLYGEGRCCRQASDCESYLVCAFDGGAPACDAGCDAGGANADGGAVRFGTCRGVPYQGPGNFDLAPYSDLAPSQ